MPSFCTFSFSFFIFSFSFFFPIFLVLGAKIKSGLITHSEILAQLFRSRYGRGIKSFEIKKSWISIFWYRAKAIVKRLCILMGMALVPRAIAQRDIWIFENSFASFTFFVSFLEEKHTVVHFPPIRLWKFFSTIII